MAFQPAISRVHNVSRRRDRPISPTLTLLVVSLLTVDVGARRACAQTSSVYGDIAITITDESGARMPGVVVTVVSTATGSSRTIVADDHGACLAASMPPGVYAVTAQLDGFVTVLLSSVTVALGERADVRITMKVAPVAETIVVGGESAGIVETSNTDVSRRFGQLALSGLPLNVRDPVQFVATAPAVTPRPALIGSGYSFGGARVHSDTALIDGVDNTDEWGRFFLAQPPLDAVSKFQLLTGNYSAEFGHASGGIVNTILKSGSNHLHGSGFYFFRDQSLAADNYFTRISRGVPFGRPPFRQDQPGASFGGRVRPYPLFFFASYEWFHTESSSVATIDPGAASVINRVLAKKFADVPTLGSRYPRDIQYGNARIGGPGTFPTGQHRHMAVARVDWQPTEHLSTYVRDLYNQFDNLAAGTGLNDTTRTGVDTRVTPHALVISYNHIAGSRLLSEGRAQISDARAYASAPDPIGPGITIPGVVSFGRAANAPNGRRQRRLEFLENVSVHASRQDLKVGADINRVRYTSSLPGNSDGPVGGLGGVFTFPSLQAFLDGNAVNFIQGFGPTGFDQVTWTSSLLLRTR